MSQRDESSAREQRRRKRKIGVDGWMGRRGRSGKKRSHLMLENSVRRFYGDPATSTRAGSSIFCPTIPPRASSHTNKVILRNTGNSSSPTVLFLSFFVCFLPSLGFFCSHAIQELPQAPNLERSTAVAPRRFLRQVAMDSTVQARQLVSIMDEQRKLDIPNSLG